MDIQFHFSRVLDVKFTSFGNLHRIFGLFLCPTTVWMVQKCVCVNLSGCHLARLHFPLPLCSVSCVHVTISKFVWLGSLEARQDNSFSKYQDQKNRYHPENVKNKDFFGTFSLGLKLKVESFGSLVINSLILRRWANVTYLERWANVAYLKRSEQMSYVGWANVAHRVSKFQVGKCRT